MVTILDYGLGNVHAFVNLYKRLNIPVSIASNPDELNKASRIILPGVGSFDWAMNRLVKSGLNTVLERLVFDDKIPVLGICVGMQIMANGSEEGTQKGLGWIEGRVNKFVFNFTNNRIQLPHMGWNNVKPKNFTNIFKGIKNDARFYFLHSYYFIPKDTKSILAETDYHCHFASSVQSGNIYGVQFHPEKSHKWGVQLLSNFARL